MENSHHPRDTLEAVKLTECRAGRLGRPGVRGLPRRCGTVPHRSGTHSWTTAYREVPSEGDANEVPQDGRCRPGGRERGKLCPRWSTRRTLRRRVEVLRMRTDQPAQLLPADDCPALLPECVHVSAATDLPQAALL